MVKKHVCRSLRTYEAIARGEVQRQLMHQSCNVDVNFKSICKCSPSFEGCRVDWQRICDWTNVTRKFMLGKKEGGRVGKTEEEERKGREEERSGEGGKEEGREFMQ